MSNEDQSGATMIAATTVLRGHKTRIGKIGGNITLPRAVELTTLVAVGIGVFVGLIFVSFVNPSFKTYMYAAALGGGLGYFAVTFSPLQGESLLKWMGLTINSKRQQIKIDGQPVRVAIGIAYISDPARGKVRMVKGAVTVPPSQFDERGVQILPKNRNMPELLDVKKRSKGIAADDRADRIEDGSIPLPRSEGRSLTTKEGKAAAASATGKTIGRSANKDTLEQPKVGRIAAARAAQEGRSADVPAPAPPAPAPAPLQPQVPQQAGPVELLEDPFAAPPRKLPR